MCTSWRIFTAESQLVTCSTVQPQTRDSSNGVLWNKSVLHQTSLPMGFSLVTVLQALIDCVPIVSTATLCSVSSQFTTFHCSGDIAKCDPSLFGSAIPITALIADQQSSLFGHRCFLPGDVKLTLGTGSFLNVNIGAKPLALMTG